MHADLILKRLHDGIPVVIGRSTAKLNEKSMVGKARSFLGFGDGGKLSYFYVNRVYRKISQYSYQLLRFGFRNT